MTVNNQDSLEELNRQAAVAAGTEVPESTGIRVFVYGSLKQGHANHGIIGRFLRLLPRVDLAQG